VDRDETRANPNAHNSILTQGKVTDNPNFEQAHTPDKRNTGM